VSTLLEKLRHRCRTGVLMSCDYAHIWPSEFQPLINLSDAVDALGRLEIPHSALCAASNGAPCNCGRDSALAAFAELTRELPEKGGDDA